MAINYAKRVARGDFKDKLVFPGLIHTVLQRMEREEKGKALTNFKHYPVVDEFITGVYLLSPQAYRLIKKYFPVRSERSLR